MKYKYLSLLLAFFLIYPCLFACTSEPHTAVLYGKLNTDVVITLYSDGADKTAIELIDACEELLCREECVLSRTMVGAELVGVNAACEEEVVISDELAVMLSLSLALARETDGAFDPTAGALSELYDITGNKPLPPSPDDLSAARATVDYTTVSLEGNLLTRPAGTVLDFGAVAKGYIASVLVNYLLAEGVSGGVLSLGGNVAVFGEKNDDSAFLVAIRAPVGGYLGTVSLFQTAYVSTSGAYERYRVGEDGKTYHHIFDPQTGLPADSDLASVTVVDEDGARADALSTALYVMGYDAAIAFWASVDRDFDMILVRKDGEVYATPALAFEPL